MYIILLPGKAVGDQFRITTDSERTVFASKQIAANTSTKDLALLTMTASW